MPAPESIRQLVQRFEEHREVYRSSKYNETQNFTLRQAQGGAYTGQYSNVSDFGLMFYREASLWDNARWYDPVSGRFAQADSIVPAGVQGLDRYAYTNNNPVRYTDPSGHFSEEEIISFLGVNDWSHVLVMFENGKLKDRWGWLMILQRAEIGDKISITMGDMTITGQFDLDLNNNLIITVDDHNYYTDHEKAALLGDSYELTKEVDLSEFFCSPYSCTMEYYEYETEAMRPPTPYMNNKPSNPNDKSLWEWIKEYLTDYNPEDQDSSAPPAVPGGGGGSAPFDAFLLD